MHNNWLFKDGDRICHYRVAAVLIKNNKLLVQQSNNEYALPGGHVSFGETSEKTPPYNLSPIY
ncbi:MAG: hypothetical protein FWC73_13995 [Defluviitaleaceae bacterium]|nr:hypothetical protein [Defluviitaleaceae bacterium]